MDLANQLERVLEVDIETRPPGDDTAVHHTTIWPVVDDGQVYVRSLKGEAGRWYQEATASPDVAVYVDGERVEVRVVPATDGESVEHANAGYRRKYAGSPYLATMTRAEILDTTLRLDPR